MGSMLLEILVDPAQFNEAEVSDVVEMLLFLLREARREGMKGRPRGSPLQCSMFSVIDACSGSRGHARNAMVTVGQMPRCTDEHIK